MIVAAPPAQRVECSWCETVITEGPKDGTESHGICEPCFVSVLADVRVAATA